MEEMFPIVATIFFILCNFQLTFPLIFRSSNKTNQTTKNLPTKKKQNKTKHTRQTIVKRFVIVGQIIQFNYRYGTLYCRCSVWSLLDLEIRKLICLNKYQVNEGNELPGIIMAETHNFFCF